MPTFEVSFQANMRVRIEADTAEAASQHVNDMLEDSCMGAGAGFRIDDFFYDREIMWFPTDVTGVRQLPDNVPINLPETNQEKFRKAIEELADDPLFKEFRRMRRKPL